MHVLYQIPGDMSGGPLGPAEIERRRGILAGWASPGTLVEVADAPGGPLSIESHAEEFLCVPPMLAAVSRRTTQPDAIIVGCFGDPGVAAMREVFDVPVVGPFESAFHLACQLGARVGVVTVLESVVPMLDGLVRSLGLSLRYAGAVAVDVPVLELKSEAHTLAQKVNAAATPLIARGHADVLVLGCMSMAFLEIAEHVSQLVGIPVVNPARCALKTAEMLVSQRLTSSRRTYHRPPKPLTLPRPAALQE